MKYLDPKNDLVFKKVFGQHPDITKSFLNAMLEFEGDRRIKTLEFIDPNLVPETPLSKYTIVDVRCKDEKGREFIIEMQMLWTESFKSRVLFNACKNYVKQLPKSGKYDELKPVYSLCLINEIFQPEEESYFHKYSIQHQENTELKLEGLEFVFVELEKFKAQNIQDKRMMVLWLRFLTEIDENTKNISPELLKLQEIRKAAELVENAAFSDEERRAYDKYWDTVRVEKTLIDDAFDKGIRKGREEGREEGKEEGAKREKEQAACKMKKDGLPIDIIAKYTGLSIAEIEQLEC